MASVILHLPADTEQRLRARAAHNGLTLEAYLEQLAQHEAEAAT